MPLIIKLPVCVEQINDTDLKICMKASSNTMQIVNLKESFPWLTSEQHDELTDRLHTIAIEEAVKLGVIVKYSDI